MLLLLLQQQASKHFRLVALVFAVLINISLAGLIYCLTIGNNKPPAHSPITINFRQFVDSSVNEQTMEPELTIIPESEPQFQQEMVAPAQPVQPSFDANNINLKSNLILPALSVPVFDVLPKLVDVTSYIQPQTDITSVAIGDSGQASYGEPDIGFAKILHKTTPQYPAKAKRLRIEGYVLLHILVNDDGRAEEIKIIEETPRGYFVKASRKAVRRWQFENAPVGTKIWKKWRLVFEFN